MKKWHFLNPKGVTAPNLLINGDFQVNQRGQSIYSLTDGNWEYTLDTWHFRGVSNSKVALNDGAVTISNTSNENGVYFLQRLENFNESNYCGNIKVTSVDGIVNFYIDGTTLVGEQQIQLINGTNVFQCNGLPTQVVFQLNAGASITINYVDLFEGKIVYKHQKESYSVALNRCLPYIEVKNVDTIGMYNDSTSAIYYIDYYRKKEIPTIKILSMGNVNGDATLPNKEATNVYTYGTISKNGCGMVSQFEAINGVTGKCCKIQYVKILISCEKT